MDKNYNTLAKALLDILKPGEWEENIRRVEGWLKDYDSIQKKPSNYDDKGNAKHYTDQRINVIRMLESIWGTEAVMLFCEMNAFKYRMRVGKKDDPKQELIKTNWYERMAAYLKNKVNKIEGLGTGDVPLYPDFAI